MKKTMAVGVIAASVVLGALALLGHSGGQASAKVVPNNTMIDVITIA